MEVKEPSPLNIDELAKKIEERIKALEGNKTTVVEKPKDIEMTSEEKAVISNFDQILEEIERRIQELDEEAVSEFDVDDLMDRINKKLSGEEEIAKDNVTSNNEAISMAINETIRALEEKKRRKKAQKAKYCDLARKKEYEERKNGRRK